MGHRNYAGAFVRLFRTEPCLARASGLEIRDRSLDSARSIGRRPTGIAQALLPVQLAGGVSCTGLAGTASTRAMVPAPLSATILATSVLSLVVLTVAEPPLLSVTLAPAIDGHKRAVLELLATPNSDLRRGVPPSILAPFVEASRNPSHGGGDTNDEQSDRRAMIARFVRSAIK